MKIVIDIPKELYEAYKDRPPMLGDVGMDMIAQSIANGIPLPEHHGDLIEMKCMGKCFICGKEIQRDSIPRIEEPKIDKIILGKDKEEHLVCDTCGNLLTIMYKMLNDGTSEF